MTDDTATLIHWLRIAVRGNVTEWERKFCASVLHAYDRGPTRRGPWRPSARQRAAMQRIVARVRSAALRPDQGEVIE